MGKVYWSWQAVLCLVLLLLFWLIYAVCITRYWRRRKEAFFLIRTPWLAVLASTCNLVCISSILLQCIVEATSYAAEQAGEDPFTLPHYPCLVVLFTSIYLYPAQLTGGVLRTVIAVIHPLGPTVARPLPRSAHQAPGAGEGGGRCRLPQYRRRRRPHRLVPPLPQQRARPSVPLSAGVVSRSLHHLCHVA